MTIQIPINDMDEEMAIATYGDDYVVVCFANSEEEYLNEAMIYTDRLPAVIEALQAEYDRRTAQDQ